MIEQILSDLQLGEDGIYSHDFKNIELDAEVKLRELVASHNYQDYLHEISKHHSVPVMDSEVILFLSRIPKNASIIEVFLNICVLPIYEINSQMSSSIP